MSDIRSLWARLARPLDQFRREQEQRRISWATSKPARQPRRAPGHKRRRSADYYVMLRGSLRKRSGGPPAHFITVTLSEQAMADVGLCVGDRVSIGMDDLGRCHVAADSNGGWSLTVSDPVIRQADGIGRCLKARFQLAARPPLSPVEDANFNAEDVVVNRGQHELVFPYPERADSLDLEPQGQP